MAEWKKVIVSGSAAELSSLTLDTGLANSSLANDGITIAGVDTSLGGSITAATIGNAIGAFSASAQVTGITNAQLANDGITIAGVDTSLGGSITATTIGDAIGAFSSSAQVTGVTNAQLANDGITIAGVDTSLGGTITAATIGNAIGAFSGSAQVTGITTAQLTNDGITIAGVDTSLGGAITAATIGDAIGAFSGSAQVTGITNAQLVNDGITIGAQDTSLGGSVLNDLTHSATGSFTGSFTGDGSGLTGVSATSFDFDSLDNTGVSNTSLATADLFAFSDNSDNGGTEKKITYQQLYGNIFGEVSNDATIATNGALTLKSGVVSSSAFNSTSQGTVSATINGVQTDVDTGLQTGDSPTFANLTVSGDLTVQGDVTELQTTNLNVEDQFILLHSGSSTNTNDSGIIFGGSGGTAQQGKALIWDSNYAASGEGRLAISTADVTWNSTSNFDFGSGDGYYVAGVFEGTAVAAANAQADHNGNIRIESNEIYIYA